MIKFQSREIRLLRQSRQIKQSDAARKMNITKQRYSELENNDNRPPARTRQILALLGYTEETARQFLKAIPPPTKIQNK